MADPVIDASTRAALQKLVDIIEPPPVSFVPQTWGWLVLAVLVLTLAVCAVWRWHRHREANRYRAEALAELALIEKSATDCATPGAALAAIPPLLKRVALVAWPRSRVAALSKSSWTAFLGAAENGAPLPRAFVKLLDDAEYRPSCDLDGMSADDVRLCLQAARHWIKGHHVSP